MPQLTKVFEDHEIRIIHNGEALFVAKDLCKALTVDTSQTRRLDNDEKGLCTVQTPGGPQKMTVVNEAGAYRLIFTSRKPEAERLKRWLAHDVLPELRKTGSYHMGDGAPVPHQPQGEDDGDILALAGTLLEAAKEAREERRVLKHEQRQLEGRIEDLESARQAPKTATTRYGHSVSHHTWDGMRKAINARVQANQKHTGNQHNAVWRYLYDSVERKYGFHPLKLYERRGGSSAIKCLDFDEMRAVFAVSEWLF